MGIFCLVSGRSGTGKTRSLCHFGEDEIFLVNMQGKPLPFRKRFSKVYTPSISKDGKAVDVAETICAALKKMGAVGIKTAVLDDFGYIQTQEFMAKHTHREGTKQFDLYNEIADSIWKVINCITRELPEDTIVYVMMHETTSDYGEVKLRTIGKLLDDKVCIEGLSTISLRCMTDGKRHWFQCQNGGNDTAKSPEGMFDTEIENDLKLVDQTIREYYGFEPVGEHLDLGTEAKQEEAVQEAQKEAEKPAETEIENIDF